MSGSFPNTYGAASGAGREAFTAQERVLYHQIHPLKLATDWGTGFLAAWIFWHHRLMPGLAIGLIPSVIASAVVIQYADLARLKHSAFGRYVAIHMNHAMEGVRLAGVAIFWIGAWTHHGWLMPLGIAVVIAGWSRGLVRR